MRKPVWIDRPLLDEVTRAAQAAPRRRRNRNFHAEEAAPCNRLLNATEPESYIRPHRHTFHSLVALEPGSVFFEAKAGPYEPLTDDEVASWAPAEGDPEAAAYYRKLVARFA